MILLSNMKFGLPILWRYMSAQYLKVFLFTTLALVMCLLTLRLDEIAHFASLDQSGAYIFAFVAYQIPYILPIAIPLACLTSAMILVQRLSETHEIAAMRALGYSLTSIFSPLVFLAALIALLNIFITSEVATATHLQTNLLKTELRSINPLLLLQNKHLLRVKGIYFDALGPSKMGEMASDVVIAMPGKKGERLTLFVAKKLETKGEDISGESITLLSSPDATEKVLIENIGKTTSEIQDFSDLIQKKVWSLNDDYLNFKFLQLRLNELRESPHDDAKKSTRDQTKILSEMARRLSLGLAPFTFTLMGLSFGLSIGRRESRRGIVWVTGLATLFMTTFFLAKGSNTRLEATLALYFLPHLLIVAASLYNLRKVSHGIE